jgi:RNA polymerase sigma-70 factor (ECF subfamily)
LVPEPEEQAVGRREEEESRWSEWMCRANDGDETAYANLLEEIGGVMEQYLRRRFGGSDFVEDCVQESLLSIHRARASYDRRRRFRPWMFTIVRHKAIDMLRRRGTRGAYEVPEGDTEHAAPENEPGAALQTAQALSVLEPKYRDALVLTKLQGHSLAEAAERAGVTAMAMKSRVHRAIRQLQQILEDEED